MRTFLVKIQCHFEFDPKQKNKLVILAWIPGQACLPAGRPGMTNKRKEKDKQIETG
jgi:hypothetical protein